MGLLESRDWDFGFTQRYSRVLFTISRFQELSYMTTWPVLCDLGLGCQQHLGQKNTRVRSMETEA